MSVPWAIFTTVLVTAFILSVVVPLAAYFLANSSTVDAILFWPDKVFGKRKD
jgi:hypothetical protein